MVGNKFLDYEIETAALSSVSYLKKIDMHLITRPVCISEHCHHQLQYARDVDLLTQAMLSVETMLSAMLSAMTMLSVVTHHVKTCTCVNKSTSRAYCS